MTETTQAPRDAGDHLKFYQDAFGKKSTKHNFNT